MTKYEDYDWAELPEDAKKAAKTLGYNQKMWDNDKGMCFGCPRDSVWALRCARSAVPSLVSLELSHISCTLLCVHSSFAACLVTPSSRARCL